MGFLTQAFAQTEEQPERQPEQRAGAYYDLIPHFGGNTQAGPQVTVESSLRYSAVWACVRLISESIASLPLHLYRRVGRTKEKAIEHPLYSILHDLANPEQTAMEFREMYVANLLLWGTGFANREYDGRGILRSLRLLPTRDMTEAEKRNGILYYKHSESGETEWLSYESLFVTRGLSGNGFFGYSPIGMAARQATGLGLATEEYGARFFSNGARPGGVLKHPGTLGDVAFGRLQQSFGGDHQGLSNAHRLKILEEGMDYQAMGVPPEEAQFLETRKFQTTEIARIFRVPPHMIADLERATFTNIEHQGLEFVIHTLRPWLVRIEQAIWRDLLSPGERTQYFAKHSVDGLLRGDIATRYQAYSTGVQIGVITRNEVRDLEDRNPLDGLDEPLQPLNLIEAGEDAPDSQPTRSEYRSHYETRQTKVRTINRYVRLFEESAQRLVNRETADIRRAARKFLPDDVDGFREWLENFYRDLRDVIPDYFDTLMGALADQIFEIVGEELNADAPEPADLDEWIERYLENFSEVYAVGGEKQLRALLEEADEENPNDELILERMDGWQDNRASKTGMEQAFEAGNALAVLGYTVLGVRELVWQGGDCPLCRKLNGKRIPIDGAFAEEGDEIEADDDETAPLPVVRTIRHGPLHRGCDCTLRAG